LACSLWRVGDRHPEFSPSLTKIFFAAGSRACEGIDVEDVTTLSDADLVRTITSATTTDEVTAALSVVYQRHYASVLRRCSSGVNDLDLAADLAHDTFEVAFHDLCGGRPPREPAKLRAWLYGIARNRYDDYRRGLTGSRGLDPLLLDVDEPDRFAVIDEDEIRHGSQARQAHVDRLLATVARSLTERQRVIFDLCVVRGLRGERLGAELGVSAAQASREAHEITRLAYVGFGALVLALEGRPYCRGLADILDSAGWDGVTFTRDLRERIVRHWETCARCDDCRVCAESRERLVRPLAPVLIPVLAGPELRDRVEETIARVAATTAIELRTVPAPASGRHQRRPARRGTRALPLLIGAAVLLLILGGSVLVPRLIRDQDTLTPAAGAPPGAPATLAGSLGAWRVTWTSGPRQLGPSTWTFLENCPSTGDACEYTLKPSKDSQGPEGYSYTEAIDDFDGVPYILKLKPRSSKEDEYSGSHKGHVSCGNTTADYPMNARARLTIRVLESTDASGVQTATKLAVTWINDTVDISPEARAVGCTEKNWGKDLTYTGTALRQQA
jgi:RNA polymerase sigma factor (sigma-70 family)